ncbi:MarR family winged helix-turn-helix transcriptional regulator [uncultured Mitsuokella sp.]|uniref:MarR family winged helix-turn-helix transcriptional regulator n=1 Tax=uncultured Mitsuokella sp. TaxID=453120 RepID=UPI00267016C6|nr:MarR family transcriptional regulator [uncultured Mitsuokella sp.]
MKRELIPSWEELEHHKKIIPEIKPAAVIAMLEVKQAGEDVQRSILDILQREYHLSEGKFCTLIVLHQNPQGLAPSEIAAKVGVTKATISNMLMRMARDGDIVIKQAPEDARKKLICLTDKGRAFMDEVLPPHYLRVTKLMERLTEDEQKELIRLLKKMSGSAEELVEGYQGEMI